MLVIFFGLLFLAVLAGAALFVFRKQGSVQVAQNTTATTQAAVVPVRSAPVAQSQTTVDVTATTATAPTATTVTTVTTTPVPVPTPTPTPVPVPMQPKPKPQPRPADTTAEPGDAEETTEEEATSSTSFPTYTEGGAEIANQSALNVARMQLKNVKQVALIGNGGHVILMNQLAEHLRDSGLSVVDGADVVIYFNAQLDRLGRGRGG